MGSTVGSDLGDYTGSELDGFDWADRGSHLSGISADGGGSSAAAPEWRAWRPPAIIESPMASSRGEGQQKDESDSPPGGPIQRNEPEDDDGGAARVHAVALMGSAPLTASAVSALMPELALQPELAVLRKRGSVGGGCSDGRELQQTATAEGTEGTRSSLHDDRHSRDRVAEDQLDPLSAGEHEELMQEAAVRLGELRLAQLNRFLGAAGHDDDDEQVSNEGDDAVEGRAESGVD